jgi:hypothetical protein
MKEIRMKEMILRSLMLASILGSSMIAIEAQPPETSQNQVKAVVEQFGHAPQNAQEFNTLVSEIRKKLKENEPMPFPSIERYIVEVYKVSTETVRQWEINNYLNPNTRSEYLDVAERFMYDPKTPYSVRLFMKIIEANRILAKGVVPDNLVAEIAADKTLHPRVRREYACALSSLFHSHTSRENVSKMLRQIKGEEPIESTTPGKQTQQRFEMMYLLLTLPPNDPDLLYYGLTEDLRHEWAQELLNNDPLAQLDAGGDPIDVGRRLFLEAILNDDEEEEIFDRPPLAPGSSAVEEGAPHLSGSTQKPAAQAQDAAKTSDLSPKTSRTDA